jgi:hypothetical protein
MFINSTQMFMLRLLHLYYILPKIVLINRRQGENKLRNRLGSTCATVILVGIALLLAIDVGFSLYNPDRLDDTLPVCRLDIISGSIKVQTKDTLTWEKAEDGMVLAPGSRVRTAPDSQASITFFQGTTTKLEPGTDLIVVKLDSDKDNQPDSVVLKQQSGKTWNQVAARADGDQYFLLQTSSADIKVRGTLFSTEVDESGKTLVKTNKGRVDVSAQGEEVQVNAGTQTEVEPGAPPAAPAPVPPVSKELVFNISQSAIARIIEPGGSSTGYMPDGSPVNQISGSSLSAPGMLGSIIRIPEPDTGEYTIILNGVSDGTSTINIRGFSEGRNTFIHTETSNITAADQLVLKLHLDVLDGIVTATEALTPDSEESPPEEVVALPEPPQSDEEEPSGLRTTYLDTVKGYALSQWVAIPSVIVLFFIVLTIVWRKT